MIDSAGMGRVTFEDFVLDVDARTLVRGESPIPLEPQVFDVLALLVEHRDRVVTKLELLDRVWGDRFVSPATLTSRIRDLRAALGDSGRHQRLIRTAHGRGFQFVGDVFAVSVGRATGGDEPSAVVPASVAPPIGRSVELADALDLLREHRIVTLVGPGGIGKTHLLQQILAHVGPTATLVELADARSGEAVRRSVLRAVGGTEQPDVPIEDAILRVVAGRRLLLALDNCEQVLDSVSDLIDVLLERAPELQVTATSRTPLRLRHEGVVRLGPLAPAAAAELVVEQVARHGQRIDSDDPLIGELCTRLDRLPLALVLAAAKLRALPLASVVDLLDQRFELLTSDRRDSADHHRSLEMTIAWSFDLLTDDQRQLLRRLAIIVGAFTLDDARPVSMRTDLGMLDDLTALVDLSLVVHDAERGRYRLLESIRLFAESLGVEPDVVDRHRDHVLTVVETAGAMTAATFDDDLDTLRATWPSLRAIVGRAIDTGDADTVHRAVAGVTRFAEQTFAFEVLDWIEVACSVDRSEGRATPDSTHVAAALLSAHRGQFAEAAMHLSAIDDHRTDSGDGALTCLAHLWHRYFTGDIDAATRAVDEALRIDGGSGSYCEVVAIVGRHFLDKGAQRPTSDHAIARIDRLAATVGDGAIAAGAELCAIVRLDWETDAAAAIQRSSALIETANRLGLAFLGSGASTARSIVWALTPDARSAADGLIATLRAYCSTGSWQFALADFGATALTLCRLGDAVGAAELLGSRARAGYVGDSSNDVAESAAAQAEQSLGAAAYRAAVERGKLDDVEVALRTAIARLERAIDT